MAHSSICVRTTVHVCHACYWYQALIPSFAVRKLGILVELNTARWSQKCLNAQRYTSFNIKPLILFVLESTYHFLFQHFNDLRVFAVLWYFLFASYLIWHTRGPAKLPRNSQSPSRTWRSLRTIAVLTIVRILCQTGHCFLYNICDDINDIWLMTFQLSNVLGKCCSTLLCQTVMLSSR